MSYKYEATVANKRNVDGGRSERKFHFDLMTENINLL